MIDTIKQNLWNQFGASIDMLENAIAAWPEERWHTDRRFYYMAYHVLVFLDYYLSFPVESFAPRLAYTDLPPDQPIPAGALDDLVPASDYTRAQLLDYLHASRDKCRAVIAALTPDRLAERWVDNSGTRNYAVFELLLYNMRHVQHHTAQLNTMLRQATGTAPKWIRRTSL